ncbi:MAG TPA: hypothetical protein VN643_16660 [Pyrinomonadaceae bacterium]|nr:hypothetical protein [Pyrinomonadaceae bacterium]
MNRTLRFLLMASICAITLPLVAYSQGKGPKVEVFKEIKHDISPPLRSIPPIPPDVEKATREHPVKPIPQPKQITGLNPDLIEEDRAVQRTLGPLVAINPPTTFDGIGVPNYGVNSAPPDTNGAAGLTQYVQWVNTAFGVFDKATGNLIFGPANGNTLWAGFGGRCETDNDGDPIVQYDKIANRWIMTQFAVSVTPYRQCVAVSTTGDATGSYARYEFTYGTSFNDYPKVGVWPDAYYITYNMFANGLTFSGSRLCALDRTRMLAGLSATQQCFQLSSSFGGVLPADLDGPTLPPVGEPNYMVNFGTARLNVWKFHVDWVTPASTTLTGPTNLPVNAFTIACGNGGACIKQPSTNQKLDSLGDRLMYRLAYRNRGAFASLVVNHSVRVGSGNNAPTGVRWYELRVTGGTPSVFQQGTFSPDTNYRWMGSMAMDKMGNIGLGYSKSSTGLFPSIFFTGRAPTDLSGTMQAETNLFGGAGSQNGGLNRWGDYSSLSVDPVDDCTLWYTTEYLKSTGSFNWSTRIGKLKFTSCI